MRCTLAAKHSNAAKPVPRTAKALAWRNLPKGWFRTSSAVLASQALAMCNSHILTGAVISFLDVFAEKV